MRFRARAFFFSGVLVLAGCGGGGGSSIPAGSGPSQARTAQIPITVLVPAVSAQGKRPAFISPNTQSLAIYVWATGSSQPATPTATINISGCPNTNGTLTCTASVTAPIASVDVRVDALAGTNATGALLSTATVPVTVSTGMAPLNIALNGTPSLIRLSLEAPVLTSGTAATSKLDVNAFDASGNLIVAPGTFSTPVTVSSDSTSVTLSGTTANTPGTQLTITYGGGNAPYAIHFSGSGGSVPSTSIIGATLVVTPANSFAVLANGYSNLYQLTTVGVNATGSEPPQSQSFLSAIPGVASLNNGVGFAYLPGGTIAIASQDNTSMCALQVYPGSNPQTPVKTTYPWPSDSPTSCALTAEPNGDILAADGNSTDDIQEYSVASNGVVTLSTRNISLVGTQIPVASVGPIAMATNSSGQVAVLARSGSTCYALVYASGATGAAIPSQFITLSGTGSPQAIAIAPDGTIAIGYLVISSSVSYRIDRFNAAGSLAGSISPQLPAGFSGTSLAGLTFDASGNLYVLDEPYANNNFAVNLDLFAGGQFGTLAPTATIALSEAPGVGSVVAGPALISSPAPQATPVPVSGDMFGYAPSRTWTYLVTPDGQNQTPFYFGIYADPNLVNGNIRLVGFQSTTSNPFSGGTLVGSGDFAPISGGYLAVGFASVSSGSVGTSGTVPGTPLFVPNSLSLNTTWNPLQNQTINTAIGISASAQVVGGGAVPGIAACPAGSATTGATVQYSFKQAAFNYSQNARVSFVPGCGMTGMVTQDGGTAVLQSVGSMPSLGQQIVPAGQPPIVQALHALWRATFGIPGPHSR